MEFDLVGIRIGKLPTNSLAYHVTGKLVKIQRDLQTLFPGHGSVTFNLLFEGSFRRHAMVSVFDALLSKSETHRVVGPRSVAKSGRLVTKINRLPCRPLDGNRFVASAVLVSPTPAATLVSRL